MRLLLDTHIFLWAVAGSPSLKAATREIMEAADEIYVSAASIWEIAIKARLGKIAANPLELASAITASGFLELAVTGAHAAGVAGLELHHNDPFDRILIAQALSEPLKLLTADGVLTKYSDIVLLVQ
jgi:PIN domain nuclease of toxin-antitoxin system